MSKKSEPGAGVKVFNIWSEKAYKRQRCFGMTDTERQWRAQFLKDQRLSPNEPRDVPELYKDTTHFLRRLWRTPMWKLEKSLTSVMGINGAHYVRHAVGKGIGLLCISYLLGYYFKYNSNDWTNARAWTWYKSQRRIQSFEPDYPNFKRKTEEEYYDNRFYSSPYARKIEIPLPAEETVSPVDGAETSCPSK